MNLPEPDIDMSCILPWPTICALACLARIRGCDLDQIITEALRADLERRQHER